MRIPIEAGLFRELVAGAVQAPTAENRHHVRFRHADGALLILADEVYAGEHPGRLCLYQLGLGAAIENIALQLAAQGLSAVVEHGGAEPRLLARVTAAATPGPHAALAQAIYLRHTNRLPRYRGPRLAAEERAAFPALDDLACRIHWPSAAERRQLVGLAVLAERARYAVPTLHRELFADIRFELGWQALADEGLSPAALGIEWFARPFFSLLRHWPVARALRTLGGDRLVAMRAAALPLRLAPDVCVIATATRDADAALRGGRAMQRVWLHAARQGFAVQPMAAAALYANVGYPGVPQPVHQALLAGWRGVMGDMQPLMVLRMGRTAAFVPHARRPAPDAFVID